MLPGSSGLPDGLREFDDTRSTRRYIYENVLDAVKRRFPVEDDNYRLELLDARYDGPQEFSLVQQKNALLRNQNLRTPIVGKWRLTDKRTGKVLDEREDRVMSVPYWTDRGTLINNGSEYTVVSQSRLRPGVYARRKTNGGLEAQFNIRPGTGRGFRIGLNQRTGVFDVSVGQGHIPLYQVLRGLGVEDRDIARSWGGEVASLNASKSDPQAWRKLYERMAGPKADPNASDRDRMSYVRDRLAGYEVDQDIVERTMGLRNVTGVTPELLLRASQKLLNISRGDEQPDKRDSPRFASYWSVEDFLKERIDKDAGRLAKTLLFKARRAGSLKPVRRYALNPYMDAFINGSGLAMPGEEANPLSTLEQMSRISKFGEGGIGSPESVTMEAREVQGDYLGFVDPVQGPECVPGDTEVHTRDGWTRFDSVTTDTEFTCFFGGRVQFSRPIRVVRDRYRGPMCVVSFGDGKIELTPGHRLFVRDDGNADGGLRCGWRFVRASELYDEMTSESRHAPRYHVPTCQPNPFGGPVVEITGVAKTQYDGSVYCATVPGGMLYVRRDGCLAHWTGNSEKIGVDVRATYHTYKGRDNKIYGEFTNARTGKTEYVDIATAADRKVAFPGQDMTQPYVFIMKDGVPQKARTEDVDYIVPNYGRMVASNTNMNIMPTSVQAGRQFYASKFWSQYLPQAKGEVPLVDSLMPDGKTTWSEYYGRKVGTIRSDVDGIVTAVDDDSVTVKDHTGKRHKVELVKSLPFNRMSGITFSPSVKVGQDVRAGDMLAHSNFTDARTGAINMGQNLHVAVSTATGGNFEDAHVISESAAKRLATDRLYSFDHDARNGVTIGRDKYISAFPSKFTKAQVETIDENGVVKPGTVLHRGDPIVLSLGPRILKSSDKALGKLSKALRNSFTDRSEVWEHDYEGTVVDAVRTPGGAKVNVSAQPPVRPGDKLCYDPETEVLTSHGWKCIADVTLDDNVATLDPDTGMFDYIKPETLHAYEHHGKMYRLKTQQLDLLVTPNHNMLVQPRGKSGFEFRKAEDIFGKRVSYKKDGSWEGFEPKFFTFPAMMVGHRWGSVLRDEIRMPIETFLMLLGMYLSEGNCVNDRKSSTYGIDISQRKPSFVKKAKEAFAAAGLDMPYGKVSGKFRLHGAQYLEYFRQFGRAFDKFVPDWVFGLSTRLQRILLKWLMWGDGHSEGGRYVNYTTTSRRLADDVQRLCLHCGYAANIVWSSKKAGTIGGMVDGHEIVSRHDAHDVRIIVSKLTPTVNHGHVRSQSAQTEEYVDYDGMVYCCTMPKWHAIYVRRNGKPCWCGNSGRYGLKGVVGEVRPDDQMPRDAATNQPYDMLVNPMGFLSRVAPGQIMEMSLGKLAKKTGRQVRIPQLPPQEGWYNWVKAQMDANGIPDSSDMFDPATGKIIKGIGDGYMFVSAFHHLAEKKESMRGAGDAAYTQDDQPAKGGVSGAKRLSVLDSWALLSHGATDVIKDALLIRGTRNDSYWNALKLGLPIPEPEEPFIYKKFLNTLRAGGINVVEKGNVTQVLPQTDKDVERLAGGRVLSSADMVDPDFEPVKGGLFDLGKTGGMAGNQWSMIELPEPVPNPIMEEPVRRVLGLTVEKMEGILAGREKLDGKTGGTALRDALSKIDVDKTIEQSKKDIVGKRGANRDNAVKVFRYLTAMKEQGLYPQDWMVSKVPVLPPVFRPVSKMGDVALVSDMNSLYKDVIENANNFRELRKELSDDGLADERLDIYRSVKAAYGLGQPISPENAAKGVKGAVRQVIGTSPKWGMLQSKVLSKTLDTVGRGVITPDQNLDMDQIGIPESMAWEMYKPYVTRGLVRQGYPASTAIKMIADKTDTARHVLDQVMQERPIIMDRAPTWHKFNLMAFRPSIIDGRTIRVCPLVVSGFNADFDGNCTDFDSKVLVRISKSMFDYLTKVCDTAGNHQNQEYSMSAHNASIRVVDDGNSEITIKIGEFPRVGMPTKDKNGANVYRVPDGIRVLSVDPETGRSSFEPVSTLTVEHDCDTVEVSFGSRSVIVSKNESISVFDQSEGRLVRAKPSVDETRLVPIVTKDPSGFGTFGDRDLGWFFGSFISDGWISGRTVGYTKLEDTKRYEFVRILRNNFQNFEMYEYRDVAGEHKLGRSAKVHCNGRDLVSWMSQWRFLSDDRQNYDSLGKRSALFKMIDPAFIEGGSEEFLWGLLTGLIDGDGSVICNTSLKKKRFSCRIGTSSKYLRDDICRLLYKLGIRYSVTIVPARGWSNEAYVVCPSTVDVYRNLSKLSFVGENEKAVAAEWTASSAPVDNLDIVPVSDDEYNILRRAPGFKTSSSLYTSLNRTAKYGARHAGRQYLMPYLGYLRENARTLADRIENVCTSWVDISGVKEAGRRDVFDLCIDSTKVFVVNDGITIWDTVNIHVPSSDKAVHQALEKMTPSANLVSLTDLSSPRHPPSKEQIFGLYAATSKVENKPAKVFNTVSEAKQAYARGEIGMNDPIEIRRT